MIKEFIVKTALKEAYDAVKKLLNKSEFRIITPEKGLSESISFHIQFVDTWSSEISFSDLRQNKKIHNIYVPLDIFLYPSRIRIERSERPNTIEIDNLFNSENTHFIISGQPGAGKTTSMKYLCHRIIHDESFYPDLFNFPIVIRFRDLNSDKLESEIDALGSFQSLIFK
ncbi:MAG: hypothetical protein MI892_11155, partial [Desulfobacterales bacterium]|nr:hypothetical protein [Desulfobacterales bacterium]